MMSPDDVPVLQTTVWIPHTQARTEQGGVFTNIAMATACTHINGNEKHRYVHASLHVKNTTL